VKGFSLGKKISVPKDVMIEELNLTSNRGSRMFQERLRRAEKFTLENAANGPYSVNVRNTEMFGMPTSYDFDTFLIETQPILAFWA